MPKTWNILPRTEENILTQLLRNRGIGMEEEKTFLEPDYERDVHSPWLFLQMRAAVDRIFLALERREKIVVHGDYDADGVCGTALLVSVLRMVVTASMGDTTRITAFLPDREKDGYGLALHTVEYLREQEQASLIITVDCGISNGPSIARARELGMDVIVCDHHALPEVLPDGAILLHPRLDGETYPNKHLCGTGVAGKLGSALLDEAQERGLAIPIGAAKWLLDLIAIATVTDVVSLVGENRVLERYGLVVLGKTRRPGLRALLAAARLDPSTELDTWNIGFQIGPRLNAAGRMKHASISYDLLVEEDVARAAEMAKDLDGHNRDRQIASDALFREAREQAGNTPGPLLIACGEEWALGLVGLVAGKLQSEFQRPTFVVAQHGERFTGSGRSSSACDLMELLRAGAEHYHRFGGHPQACGFTILGRAKFDAAMAAASACARELLGDAPSVPTCRVDAEITLEEINDVLVADIERLRPFGEGNPVPTFATRGLSIVRLQPVGREGKHLRLVVRGSSGSRTHEIIGFGFGHLLDQLAVGGKIDAVFEIGTNIWAGKKSIQLRLIDVKI